MLRCDEPFIKSYYKTMLRVFIWCTLAITRASFCVRVYVVLMCQATKYCAIGTIVVHPKPQGSFFFQASNLTFKLRGMDSLYHWPRWMCASCRNAPRKVLLLVHDFQQKVLQCSIAWPFVPPVPLNFKRSNCYMRFESAGPISETMPAPFRDSDCALLGTILWPLVALDVFKHFKERALIW